MSSTARFVCTVHWVAPATSPVLARRVTIDVPEDMLSTHEPERTMVAMVEDMTRHALRDGYYTWSLDSKTRLLG